MCKRQSILLILFCTFYALLTLGVPSVVMSQEKTATAKKFIFKDIKSTLNGNDLALKLVGTTEPAYTVSERFSPFRVILDVADASFAKGVAKDGTIVPKNDFVSLMVSEVALDDTKISRFEFTLADSHSYKITREGTTLKVIFSPNTGDSKKKVDEEKSAPEDNTLKQLLASSEQIAVNPENGQGEKASTEDSRLEKLNDAFLGYNKERISIDFYKIDIHNVFRLFREVSGLNILVDEAVSGTVTIAMNDVPWDFALDVILNLKGLAKEERYNTIVIYPQDKGFVWPSDASSNLTIEADTEIITQEELIIEESANQPKEIILAKELLGKAKNYELKGLFEKAAENYYQAHELWPQNSHILDRLTTIYLVNLQMNARALHFAKKSLELDKDNTEAALYAAISSANMGRTAEAAEFFRHSISASPPAKEALMSFAAFSENNGNNDTALKLLDKLHKNYGESIESMVAVARILDKKGEYAKADKQYAAILASGFQMRPALKNYIAERLNIK